MTSLVLRRDSKFSQESTLSIFHITNDIVFMKMIGKRLDDALEAIGF
ncbi:hypothetical protein RUMHYD_03187 [Blautia hydrogenotrophica DSM 10507]|uniref:Uncharacterized protein n=1 Tax=Blautia hydrogenotrophica (strain DSM 10507 / JCM 14656 / S5a33) TaxID=476272 RepID=C0CQM4_BLAHS|nr:hypothetical protein RUMHYD_03187 [Blautia hydrogenotrophica DSM 10507]